ncbi:Membrane carboxypeptidase (penicillin-binding protein) [Nakamurella panacisegetis]|uniref:Membrane carboxypeptidase (Penicillin-binding protein) n=1 Tax=Nakamurella panacisegetis TaxID=1090615 RepID=A0A1H0N7X3_9ACTN|nr:penicillin-binding protein [Nakamurella panacisegetis]SDO88763.1 Membrane carboxypeptidase (penicillin-binding protein) [Nakamurella panacisegetis]
MTIATLLAGVLVAGLLLPYSLGLGLASNKITGALAATNENVLDGVIPERSAIYDNTGTNLITYVYDQNRQIVPSAKISQTLKSAIVAIEDKRFFIHKGVDWRGTVRALLSNASGGQQGGSTLTQQYVKNYLFLVQAKTDAEKAAAIAVTPGRKLREAKLALTLEQKETKDDILTGYLNLVAFLPNVYGAEATAEALFGVHASDLTLAEAAMMAGMVNNPNKYNPTDQSSYQDSIDRRNVVLTLMTQQGYITTAQMQAAKSDDLRAELSKRKSISTGCVPRSDAVSDSRFTNGYYCQYALDYLATAGISASAIADGGYKIVTNLDKTATTNAKTAVNKTVSPTTYKNIANVMAVVQPNSNRKVLALVANRPYGLDTTKGQTVQKLTTTFAPLGAGSTFKIFTAAAALKAGLGINSKVDNPVQYASTIAPAHAFHNNTDNAETFPTRLSITDALATSPNTAFVELEDKLTLPVVVNMAVALGMKGYNLPAGQVDTLFTGSTNTYAQELVTQKVASFTLGVTPVSPLELANVGASLADNGEWCPPNPINIVTDRNGGVVTVKAPATCTQAVSPDIANALARAMGEDIDGSKGTANQSAKAAGWNLTPGTAAGKTGTTGDYKSSAFLGFTPKYSAANLTWDYTPKPKPICMNPPKAATDPLALTAAGTCTVAQAKSSEGNTTATITGMTGGSVPATTWFQAMLGIQKADPTYDQANPTLFPPASGYSVDGDPKTVVPNVVGELSTQAAADLQAKGFVADLQIETQSQSVAVNHVTRQSPAGLENALPGSTVTVYYSAGPTTSGG